jgi:hypothetical protein
VQRHVLGVLLLGTGHSKGGESSIRMNPFLERCNHGGHQVALKCKATVDRHGTWQVYQDDPMPWTQLGKGVEVDASSTLKSALDTSFFSSNFYFEWAVKMLRTGLYYLLAGASVPRVLSSVLQPTPPMGKSISRFRTPN